MYSLICVCCSPQVSFLSDIKGPGGKELGGPRARLLYEQGIRVLEQVAVLEEEW